MQRPRTYSRSHPSPQLLNMFLNAGRGFGQTPPTSSAVTCSDGSSAPNGDITQCPTSSNTISNFVWQNWSWLLLASFTGLSGMWVGWELGKFRCWSKTTVGGAVQSVKSGISGAYDTVTGAAGRAKKAVGLKKKRSHKK